MDDAEADPFDAINCYDDGLDYLELLQREPEGPGEPHPLPRGSLRDAERPEHSNIGCSLSRHTPIYTIAAD
eukprot:7810135-Pyramimonas_sp.AAC.1